MQTLVVSSAQFNCYIAIPICESLLLSFRCFGWMKNSIILPHFAVIPLPPILFFCVRFYFHGTYGSCRKLLFLPTSNRFSNQQIFIKWCFIYDWREQRCVTKRCAHTVERRNPTFFCTIIAWCNKTLNAIVVVLNKSLTCLHFPVFAKKFFNLGIVR